MLNSVAEQLKLERHLLFREAGHAWQIALEADKVCCLGEILIVQPLAFQRDAGDFRNRV